VTPVYILARFELPSKSIVAVLASEVLAPAPVIFDPVQFTVELGIQEENVASILYNLL
jgi:hypothetical protein